jgi:DNA polymerase-1
MPKIFDTLTSSHLLNENLIENGLKYLTRTILHKEVMSYEEAITEGIHSRKFHQYAVSDAVNTWELYKVFSPQIEEQGLHHLAYDIEFPFQKALMWLAINGIAADASAAKIMRYEVQHLFYEIENELLGIFGGEYVTSITPRSRVTSCKPSINFNSSDQVVPLIEGLGFPIYEKSKKEKKKSWNKVSKNRLKGKHYAIDLLIKLGTVEKLLNGFLIPFGGFIDDDGRIRCSFHNTVCVTGRLSCSKPNTEQLPKNNDIANIRNLFVAGRGNVLIVADYSGQEVRIMAQESGDTNLKNALRKGYDVHLATANEIDNLGISVLGLTDKTPEHDIAKAKYKEQRDSCKSVVFGTAYGKSAYGFSKDFNCSEKEAQVFIDKFFAQYPGLRRAIEQTRQQVYKHGFVKNMSGRKRRFPDFHKLNKWGKERCYRQGFNHKIQSFGADVVKVAAAAIVLNPNLMLVNIVHDELVIECKKEYVEEGMIYINECMVKTLPIFLPWDIDINFGERYGGCK